MSIEPDAVTSHDIHVPTTGSMQFEHSQASHNEDTEMQDADQNLSVKESPAALPTHGTDADASLGEVTVQQDTNLIAEETTLDEGSSKSAATTSPAATEKERARSQDPVQLNDARNTAMGSMEDSLQDMQSGTASVKQEDITDQERIAEHNTNTQPNFVPHTIPAPASSFIADTSQDSGDSQRTTGIGSHAANAKTQTVAASRAASVVPQANESSTTTGSPSRAYLKQQVNDYLLEGMKWLVLARPENGLLALGQYLCSASDWKMGDESKSAVEFQRYWLNYQAWLAEGNAGKSEREFYATL